MTIQELNTLIDQAVNPYGGPPLIKGPAVNTLLKRLAAEIALAGDAAAGADADADLRAALATQTSRLDTLVAGAPQALDTLAELAALLAADAPGTAALLATQQQHTQQLANAVHRTGDETIAGQKTFTDAATFGAGGAAEIRLGAGVAQQTPTVLVESAGGRAAALYAGTTYAGVNFSEDGYFTISPQPRADFLTNAVAAGLGPNAFVVRGTGRVGVGTAAPRERLEVAGTVQATAFRGEALVMGDGAPVALDGAYGLFSAAHHNAGVTVNRDNPAAFASLDLLQGGSYQAGWSVQMQPDSPDLVFLNRQAAASQLHLAAASGYVGVGTAAPRERLEVAGTVQATAFRGDGSQLTGLPLARLYDGPGAHPDGAMTQQATTAALAAKADLVQGRVPAEQLPDRAQFTSLGVANLDPESGQPTGYQFSTDGRTLSVGWPDSGTEYVALGNGSCALYAGDTFAELRADRSYGKPTLNIRVSDRTHDGTLLIPPTDPSQPTSAVTVQALQQLAFTPPALRSAVAAGAFAQGELTGAAPAGSRPGMKFSAADGTGPYVYEYLLGSADLDGTGYTWVRTLRG